MRFDWLAPPAPEAMVRALETLHALGALGDDAKVRAAGGPAFLSPEWVATALGVLCTHTRKVMHGGGVGWSGFELQRRTAAPHMHTRHMLVPGGNTPQLTVPTGVHMASLPLEPALGKLLLEGCRRGCARVSWSRGEGGVGGTTWPHRLHRWACHQGHAAIADTPPRARCDRRRATARLRLTTCRKR